MNRKSKRALVTGGAGLIGSHLTDLLLEEGWSVRILDNLEPQTHLMGRPPWIPATVEFLEGDIRDRAVVITALKDIDVVFHQAAYGGFTPEISRYVHVNSFGTAQMLEIIRDENLPIKKFIVASSQAVYGEGAVMCPQHGVLFAPLRPVAQLLSGDFSLRCQHCGNETTPMATHESAPLNGETVYALTKIDQERLVLSWGKQVGIPSIALRYAVTYGPRQSIFNPYTGVVSIFCTQFLNGLPPVLYEDGEQTRDFIFVTDVARANIMCATTDALDGTAVNVGTGRRCSIRELAELIGRTLGTKITPVLRGEFRPGEVRSFFPETSLIMSKGFAPQVTLTEGIEKYVEWIRSERQVNDYFTAAANFLKTKGVVRKILPPTQAT